MIDLSDLLNEPEKFSIPSSRPVGIIRYDEVFSMSAAGSTTEDIAHALGLSTRTVLDVLARKDKPKLRGDQRARQLRAKRDKTASVREPSEADREAEQKRLKAQRDKYKPKTGQKTRARTQAQEEKDAEILRLLKEGEYVINIVTRLHTYPGRVKAIREANGIPKPPRGRPVRNDVTLRFANPELAAERKAQQDDAILQGLLRGETQYAIGQRLGVHARRITAVREAAGLPAPGRGAPGKSRGGASSV